jgi:hypothetical protein
MQERFRKSEGAATETEHLKLKMAQNDAESTEAIILTSDDPYMEKLFLLIYIMSSYHSLGLYTVLLCCSVVLLAHREQT